MESPMFHNFRVEFLRTKDGRHRERIFRIGAPLGIDVHTPLKSTAVFSQKGETISVAKPINRSLKQLSEEIVTAVEHGNRARVLEFEAYFQVDTDGTAWLTHTTNVTCGKIQESETRAHHDRMTHTEIFSDTKAESPIGDQLPSWATSGENIMGSSQSRQCPGDFCGLDFSVAEQQPDPFLDRRNRKNRPGTSIEATPRPSTSASAASRLSLPSLRGTVPKKTVHNMAGPQTISYGMILHARAEHKLVKLLIEREKRGEEGEYMQDNVIYSTASEISMQNPGSYYRRVHVCNNCFNMYSKIDEARSASAKRISTASGPRQRTPGTKRPGSRARSKLQRAPGYRDRIATPGEGKTEGEALTDDQQLELALAQAEKARNQFSLSDLAELRGFRKPPVMVKMVVRVLMRMLSGREVDFSAAQRIMANGKKFLSILRTFKEVHPSDVEALIPFLHSPTFKPELMKQISPAAGRMCEWITGMIIKSAIKYGYGELVKPLSSRSEPSFGGRLLNRATTTPGRARTTPGRRRASDSRKSDRRSSRKSFRALTGIKATSPPRTHLSKSLPNTMPDLSSFGAVTGNTKTGKKTTSAKRKKQKLRRKLQQKSLDRLAQSDLVGQNIPTSADRPEFIASDGAVMPYLVLGEADLDLKCPAFVVLHDMFDTLESMQILFSKIVRKYLGTQILFLNFPGQAYAQVANTDGDPLLHNVYLSSLLCELLHSLEKQGKFICSMRPFFLMGFGNGGNVATCFATKYGQNDVFFRSSLKGMVLFNSYSYVDEQLAAILNSTVNVVSVLPPDRPDLPVSYFSRFLFSKKYMNRVDRNIILNLYTAVSNPITNKGRVLMCKGAIGHIDLRNELQALSIPILVVQSTENNLVNPKHVDPYIEGRTVNHIWAHQQKIKSGYSRDNKQKILQLFSESERDALVVWLDAGHEIRQECKQHVLGIMELLAAGHAPAKVTTLSKAEGKKSAMEAQRQPSPAADTFMKDALKIKEFEIEAVADNAKLALGNIQKDRDKAAVQALGDRIEERLESFKEANANRERLKQEEQDAQLERVRLQREKQREQWRREDEERGQTISKEYRQQRLGREHTSRAELDAIKQREVEMVQDTAKQLAVLSKQADELALPKPGHTQPVGPLVQMTFGLQEEFPVMFVVQKTFIQNLAMAVAIHAEDVRITGEDSQKNTLTLMMKARVAQQLWKATKNGALSSSLQEFKYLEAGGKGKRERISRDGSVGPPPEEAPAPEQPGAVAMTLRIPELALDDFDKNLIEESLRAVIAESGQDISQLVVLSAADKPLTVTFKAVANISGEEDATEKKTQLQELIERLLTEGKFADGLSRSYRKTLTTTTQDAKEDSGDAIADMFAQMAEEETAKGQIYAQQYEARQNQLDAMEKVKQDLEDAEAEREAFRQKKRDARLRRDQDQSTVMIQAIVRGMLARHERERLAEQKELAHVYGIATVRAQALVRRFIARIRVAALREKRKHEADALRVAEEAQRIYRGRVGRKKAWLRRQDLASRKMQRVYRGRAGRKRWKAEKARQLRILRDNAAAARMQSVFRMYKAQILYQQRYMEDLAAIAVQRVYRGLLARRRAKRMREWAGTAPGPERLKLGLKLIENSKEAFERQRREIETLHRDQEKAEVKVSFIHAGLRESEKELGILEQELQNIDQLDQDLRELTHEKEIYDKRIQMDGGIINSRGALLSTGVGSTGTTAIMDPEAEAAAEKAKADSYALEMAIHMKRAEREKKKKELEAEFSAVMHEINDKRKALASLENAIQDMELTRHRKDREFARLQRDLMELLEEQKKELDHLREKGV